MINQVTLIGNAGRDVEVKTLESGLKVASLTIATTESYKDKSDQWQQLTEWHNIVIWRPQASVEKIKKGMKVFVQGKITNRKFPDKDGVERQRTEIVASMIRSLEPAGVGSQHTTDLPENALPGTVNDGAPGVEFSDDLPF